MRIFIDSNFFIALSKEDDSTHQKAQNALKNSQNERNIIFYTSYYVIDEVITVLSQHLSKKEAIEFLSSIDDAGFPIILEVDKDTRVKAYKFFKKTQDKNIGMIDCYSAILMKANKIKKCFTFDKHFKKLGFKIL